MAISDLNPNIAEERARPRKNKPKVKPKAAAKEPTLFALEVPLVGLRPVRCTLRAVSLQAAIKRAVALHPNAIPDGIRELTFEELDRLRGAA